MRGEYAAQDFGEGWSGRGGSVCRLPRSPEADQGTLCRTVAGLWGFVEMWRTILMDSDFRSECSVLCVAVQEPAGDEAPLQGAAVAFGNWTALLAESIRAHGAADTDAQRTATLIVAAIEGPVVMCRAERSTRPLDQANERLELLIRAVTASVD
ncbi:TetR family transcriptional regulator C-terminal domain-containing protein [Rhodococcus sp. NPDC056960]|uniref:LmrA/YxaF family transcription factor n=1 Tax=Rhodococcus sp. NPDC056960 TaxID=3345982 RepID=UPI00363F3F8B